MSHLTPTPVTRKDGVLTTVHKNLGAPVAENGRGASISSPVVSATSFSAPAGSYMTLEVNEDAPFPQANSLSKVAAVVDMIGKGASTPEAIAYGIESNSKSDRAGSYYGDALAYLGLAEKASGDGISEFQLTTQGQKFAALDPDDRQEVLAQAIGALDLVQIYRSEGEDELRKYVSTLYGDDYSDSTIERRIACISSWSAQAEDDNLGSDIANSQGAMSQLDAGALEIVARQKREAREAQAAANRREFVGEVCMKCFTTKALDGSCGC